MCSICLEDLKANICTILCGHTFHTSCIEKWYETSANCPICRTKNDTISQNLMWKNRMRVNRNRVYGNLEPGFGSFDLDDIASYFARLRFRRPH